MTAISVIVPVYNVEAYLETCVESILAQTFSGLEVILVDDGSTDRSGEICDAFAARDARVRVIRKKNGGLVSARKAGLAVATGRYAAYVDGDDFIETTLYETLYRKITQSGADVLLTGYVKDTESVCEPMGNRVRDGLYEGKQLADFRTGMLSFRDGTERTDGMFRFRFGTEPSVWSKLFLRETLVRFQNAVPDELTIGEDVAVTFPLLLRCERIAVDSGIKGYHYRLSQGSMTRGFNPDYFRRTTVLYRYLQKALGTEKNGVMREALEDYRCYLVVSELEKIRHASGMDMAGRIRHLERAADGRAILRGLDKTAKKRFAGVFLRRMEWASRGKWRRLELSYAEEDLKVGIHQWLKRKRS